MTFHWSTHQLTEYLAAVSEPQDEHTAVAVAVERAAEALDAEVSAAIVGGEVRKCFGFGPGPPPEGLATVARSGGILFVPGLGTLHAMAADLYRDAGAALVVGRTGEPFTAEERQMLQGMARMLGLTLRSLRTLAAERTLRGEHERTAEEIRALNERLELRVRERTKELRVSQERFATLARIARVGIFQTDRWRHLTYVNEEWCRITGLTPEEAAGTGYLEAMDPDDRKRFLGRWAQSEDDPSSFRFEGPLRRRSGEVLWVLATLTQEYSDTGHIVSSVGTLTDVTALRVAEQELRARNAELDGFVHSVSHDLKAPLVGVKGLASILADDYGARLDDEGRRCLGRLQANVYQMEHLIHDLLALARIGRDAQTPEAVNLSEVVDAFVSEMRATSRATSHARGVEVLQHDLGTLWGVRTEIEQVMRNLLGNALKYMGDTPTPRIEVGMRQDGPFTECHVKDNGIGIDPRHHEKVFEIFQRLRDVETEGTGVGLAIVKKIVEGTGGRVWVESLRGKGSTFRFTWPASLMKITTTAAPSCRRSPQCPEGPVNQAVGAAMERGSTLSGGDVSIFAAPSPGSSAERSWPGSALPSST